MAQTVTAGTLLDQVDALREAVGLTPRWWSPRSAVDPMALAGPPPPGTPVPPALARLADGLPLRLVWANSIGGLTARIEHPGGIRFVKWNPATSPVWLDVERRRLDWLAAPGHAVPVPTVIEHGVDADGEWLVTRGLPGHNAVSEHASEHPELAAAAIGEGLRLLHDSVDPRDCPFTWGAVERINSARRRGIAVPPELLTPPPVDPVVCHGDPCAPNTLLNADGELTGIVDLGSLGVADRWADLAVATWSLSWNFEGSSPDDAVVDVTPSQLERVLLDAYGIAPDEERTRYYRRLWAAT